MMRCYFANFTSASLVSISEKLIFQKWDWQTKVQTDKEYQDPDQSLHYIFKPTQVTQTFS